MKRIIFFLLLLLPTLLFSQQIVTLDGSGSTDPDGTVALYSWSLVSGPAPVVISNATSTSSTTTVSIPYVAGDYKFQLIVIDNLGATSLPKFMTVHVLPNPDHAPVIVPAPDQVISLPTNKVTVRVKASDSDGDKLGFLWKYITGPNVPVITNPADSVTDITGLIQGLYKIEVIVTDAPGASRRDTIQIGVNPANQPPVSNAGNDKTITLPASTVSIGLQDAPGLAVRWTKLSGPSAWFIEAPGSSITNLNVGNVAGSGEFMKEVTDVNGLKATDNVKVTVNAKSCSWLKKLFNINGCHF